MFNLNTIAIPQESQVSSNQPREQKNFPTVGFKSILQNSDLLDLLLKPIANNNDDDKKMKQFHLDNTNNYVPELSDLNLDDLLAPKKQQATDHDYIACNGSKLETNSNDQQKAYKNAFLGPSSIWDENEIFQSEKFGIEYLGIEEFLNENNLNEADIKFLDGLQNNNSLCSNSPHPATPSVQENGLNSFLSTQPATAAISSKVADTSASMKPAANSEVKVSMATLLKQWDEERLNDDETGSDDEVILSLPKKRLLKDRLVLQPALKKSKKQFVPDEMKDEKYWARRIKNNKAAKRSREARRLKENQIVIAATYLEHENEELRKQLEEYKEKCSQLQARLMRYE